ncbi:hypothetical protein [Paractinoplanes bogorensis]|uniref:hypothetical protein n=1 Tax=Paractinoplanes bogorensis TaxID=1610840 RepID=UPI0027DF1979|nr:hypothetical protein [Actinoplanes bogorensis]
MWTDNADQRDRTQLEKDGVEFLTALSPLVSALAESQSTAVQGVTEPPPSLAAAVTGVSTVDAKFGTALRTKERWADLKDKISKLPKTTGAANILNAHIVVTDLTLGLYNAVRRNSELNRDPDSDISNLQQAAAVDMPTTVVRVNRMGDYATLVQSLPAASRAPVQAQLFHEYLTVQDLVKQLTENLQAAVDNTKSQTLSGSLVSSLDAFRRRIEDMNRGADPIGGAPAIATITTAQSTLQAALGNLAGITLGEMDRMLDERLDSLDYRRIESIVMAGLALLLVTGAVLWPALSRRRDPESTPAPADRPIGESTRDVALNRPIGGPGGYGAPSPYDQAPGYGDLDPTRRERSGAVR